MTHKTQNIPSLLTLSILLALAMGCKGGSSINGPVFGASEITGVEPPSTPTGSPAIALVVMGVGFLPGASVDWNGSKRPTNFISTNRLTAQISASDLIVQKTVSITVANPDGSISNSFDFLVGTVTVPTITGLNPASAQAGSLAFTLTVDGLDFSNKTNVLWNGSSRTTKFVSSQQLTASITAQDIQAPGQATVGVTGSTSTLPFTINQVGPAAVSLHNFMFHPADITVAAGQTIIFTNQDTSTHHSVSKDVNTKPGPDEPLLSPGLSYSFKVPAGTASGTNIFFHCNFHGAPGNGTSVGPGMAGVIRVK